MIKKLAIILALLMLALMAWGLFFETSAVKIIINGHELTGPFKGAVGVGGMLIAAIAFVCATIFLLFAFAGIGVLVLAGAMFLGLVFAWLLFPYLLFVLLPLFIVWLFIALTRGKT